MKIFRTVLLVFGFLFIGIGCEKNPPIIDTPNDLAEISTIEKDSIGFTGEVFEFNLLNQRTTDCENPCGGGVKIKFKLVNGRCNPNDCFITTQGPYLYETTKVREVMNTTFDGQKIIEYDTYMGTNGCIQPDIEQDSSYCYRQSFKLRFFAESNEEAEIRMFDLYERLDSLARVDFEACSCITDDEAPSED